MVVEAVVIVVVFIAIVVVVNIGRGGCGSVVVLILVVVVCGEELECQHMWQRVCCLIRCELSHPQLDCTVYGDQFELS